MGKLYKRIIYKALTLILLLLFSTAGEVTAQYCAPSYNNPCFDPGITDDNVNSFYTTGAITNVSNLNTGCNGVEPANYIYNSGMTITVMRGTTFQVHVQCSPGVVAGANFQQGFKVWVDWDQNQVFENNTTGSCEMAFSSSSPGFQVFTGTVAVPVNAALGVTRLRVRSSYNTVPAGPCTNEMFGETEDYNIQVVANPNNPGLSVNPVTICAGQTATLTATGGGLVRWYATQTSASFIAIGPNFTTPVLNTTTTYWVQTTLNGCPSPRIPVTVTVIPPFTIAPTASTATVCAGESVTLTGPAGYATYTWTPAASFTANNVNPATATIGAPTTFTLTVTDANGCQGTGTVSVGLDAAPPLNIVASATSICPGESVDLTASGSTNGYNWLAADGLAASTNASVTASPAATVTYSVTANSSSGACPASASVTITVNPVPTADAGLPVAICEGTSAQLNGSGGTSYLWTPATGLSSATVSNPTVNTLFTTTYVLTVTNAQGCSSTDDVVVTVNPLPVANPGTGAANCSGTGAQLNGSGGVVYSWLPVNGLSNASLPNPIATPTTTTNYTLTVTDANGCVSPPSAPITVTVFNQPPAPVITAGGPLIFCQGNDVDLTVSGGVSYAWSNGATSSTITANTTGNYTATLTDANGCTSPASAPVTVTVTAGPPVPTITASGPLVFCQGGSVTLTSSALNAYEWTNGATSQAITVNTSGSYSVTVSDALGCSNTSAPVAVTVNPLPPAPTITSVGPAGFCPGGSATLQGPVNAASWLWSTGAITQTITSNVSGSYTLTVTDANGCTSPLSAAFVTTLYPQPPVPVVTASGATEICAGENLSLSTTAAQSYLWTTGQTTQNIPITNSGNYAVSVVDFNGCPSLQSAPIAVTVNPLPAAPVISAANSLSFCDGETVTLNANPSTGIIWSNGETSGSIEVGVTGQYTAIFTDVNGCESPNSNPLVVTVIPLANTPVITASGPTDICEGDSITLTSTVAPSYLWNTGEVTRSIVVFASGNYSVTTSSNCPAADMTGEIFVQVRPIPVPSINSNIDKDCLPSVIQFSANTAGIGPFSYLWTFGDGSVSTSASPSHEYVEAGDFTISLQLTDVIGCSGSQTVPQMIEVLPRANLSFTIDPPVTTLSDPLVTFTGTTSNAYAESWDIEGFGVFQDDQVQITFEDTGAYVVTYSAITAEGCEAQRRDTVFVFDEFALYVPNAFSPNGDGLNDVFVPVASGFQSEDFYFHVFNRWGQRLFSTSKPGQGWDGKNATEDVYVWILAGKSRIDGEAVEFKGSFTLIH